MKISRVLVTGSEGYIGAVLMPALLRAEVNDPNSRNAAPYSAALSFRTAESDRCSLLFFRALSALITSSFVQDRRRRTLSGSIPAAFSAAS